jgi:hypothetical protein
LAARAKRALAAFLRFLPRRGAIARGRLTLKPQKLLPQKLLAVVAAAAPKKHQTPCVTPTKAEVIARCWLTVKPQKLLPKKLLLQPLLRRNIRIPSGLLQEKNRRQVLLLPQFQKALSRQTALLV